MTVSLVHYFDIADSTSTNTRCRDGYTGVEAKLLNTLLSLKIGGGEWLVLICGILKSWYIAPSTRTLGGRVCFWASGQEKNCCPCWIYNPRHLCYSQSLYRTELIRVSWVLRCEGIKYFEDYAFTAFCRLVTAICMSVSRSWRTVKHTHLPSIVKPTRCTSFSNLFILE